MSTKNSTSNCFHKLINKEYCQKCGAIFYKSEFLIKHIKYNYPCELSPIILCQEMISSNSQIPINTRQINLNRKTKIYFEKRKEIKTLLKNMNMGLDNNSSTYFLALLYADLIFQNYSLEEIFLNDSTISRYNSSSSSQKKFFPLKHCLLVAVCCLIVASKFNEKDPHVPDLNSFIRIYNQNSKFYFIFSIDELRVTEVKIIKLLRYKLNFYSLYQFITFFFANGILFEKNFSQSYLAKKYKYSEKKILEKIYVKSRELLALMIDDYDKYFLLFNGKDNYVTAIEILTWAIESVLDIKLINEKNNYCFAKVYNINIEYNIHKEINSLLNDIYYNNNQNIQYNDASNTDASNKINYNFDYGHNIVNSDLDINNRYSNNIIKEDNNLNNNNKNNSNLFLMSIANLNQNHKSERLSSDVRNKNYNTRYNFKTKYNNKITDYFDDSQDISGINKLNTLISYDIYNKMKSKKENDENKNNNISDESNDDIKERKKKYQPNKNKYLYYGISRNSTTELNSNHYEKEKSDKNEPYKNYIRNYNEINSYNSKINSGKNYRYYNSNNLSSNSTFSKSWFNKTNNQIEKNNDMETYPKNILNKTKKIFDAKIENENKKRKKEENENFNFFINSYINKPNYAILKIMNKDKKEKNEANQNLSESNVLYKLKDNNNYRDERGKEKNSIIINNNIQINNFNYVGKEHNTYNYYYNNSQKNMKEKENMDINIDNYINKKYFNMSNMNNNSYSLFNKISKSKNKRKVNFKKNNFLGENNKENIKQKENTKENKISNNTDFISNIKKMETYKINKDKNKNLLNLGSLETYFDYGLYSRRKNVEPYNKKEYNVTKPINYSNVSYVENNENKFNNNNSLLRLNDKFIKFNKDLDISERYRKINS